MFGPVSNSMWGMERTAILHGIRMASLSWHAEENKSLNVWNAARISPSFSVCACAHAFIQRSVCECEREKERKSNQQFIQNTACLKLIPCQPTIVADWTKKLIKTSFTTTLFVCLSFSLHTLRRYSVLSLSPTLYSISLIIATRKNIPTHPHAIYTTPTQLTIVLEDSDIGKYLPIRSYIPVSFSFSLSRRGRGSSKKSVREPPCWFACQAVLKGTKPQRAYRRAMQIDIVLLYTLLFSDLCAFHENAINKRKAASPFANLHFIRPVCTDRLAPVSLRQSPNMIRLLPN